MLSNIGENSNFISEFDASLKYECAVSQTKSWFDSSGSDTWDTFCWLMLSGAFEVCLLNSKIFLIIKNYS